MLEINTVVQVELTVERSKFYATLFPAKTEEDSQKMVRRNRGIYRKACHHCWALRTVDQTQKLIEKAKDDGEVGHPGKVLLEILRRNDLLGGLIVSRIFGGIKLGAGGVSRAFRQAGEKAVQTYFTLLKETLNND